MQFNHDFTSATAQPVAWGVRILVLARGADDPLIARIAGLGGPVEVETELYAALSAIIDDPAGYGLFVMDADAHGGAEAAERAVRTLSAALSRVPVIVVSAAHDRQVFPQTRGAPVCLRAPLSSVSLRVGFEHALRDRLMWTAA